MSVFQHFDDADKQRLVEVALDEVDMLVPNRRTLESALRGANIADGPRLESICANQVHLNLDQDTIKEVVQRHIAKLFAKAEAVKTGDVARAYYFPSDPASKRLLMNKINSRESGAALDIARKWIAASGKTLAGLFHVEAGQIRAQLLADKDVQACADIKEDALYKIRALGSGVHTAMHDAVKILNRKGVTFHQLDTDNMSPDCVGREEEFLGYIRENITRTPNEHSYVMAVLMKPEDARAEAMKHPVSDFSADIVANKAKAFALTVREIIAPEKANVLLVDKDMNVILHRENGKDIAFDEAAYSRYLRSCGITMSGKDDKQNKRQQGLG